MAAIQQLLLMGATQKTYATWNPLDKNANVTLSNGNLTAAISTGTNVRSIVGVSTGKWYWEVHIDAGSMPFFVGVVTSSATLNSHTGADAYGWGYYGYNGDKFHGGSNLGYGAAYRTGDTIGVALDMDSGALTFYKNGASQGVAFTGITGTLYAGLGIGTSGTFTYTANFGATAFTYSPPSGYNAGFYE